MGNLWPESTDGREMPHTISLDPWFQDVALVL